jgi:hypothetical protein
MPQQSPHPYTPPLHETVQNLGVGGLSTPPGEKPMQREAGPTAVAVTSRFRSPPRFWTVSIALTAANIQSETPSQYGILFA